MLKCKKCSHYNTCKYKDKTESVINAIEGIDLNDMNDILNINITCNEFTLSTEPIVSAVKSSLDKVSKISKACREEIKKIKDE